MSDFERLQNRIREFLIHVGLILVIVALFACIRLAWLLPEEIHQSRVDMTAQMSALRTAVQLIGNRSDSRLQDIHTALRAFAGRVDNNITDTRATIQRLGESSQAAATQQMKETRSDISQKLDETNQSLAAVAQKADDGPKPVEVTIPASPTTAVVVPIPEAPSGPPAASKTPNKKKRPWWRKVLPPWN